MIQSVGKKIKRANSREESEREREREHMVGRDRERETHTHTHMDGWTGIAEHLLKSLSVWPPLVVFRSREREREREKCFI